MIIKDIAEGLSGLVGLGIIAIGVRFLLAPRTAAAGVRRRYQGGDRGGRCVPRHRGELAVVIEQTQCLLVGRLGLGLWHARDQQDQ